MSGDSVTTEAPTPEAKTKKEIIYRIIARALHGECYGSRYDAECAVKALDAAGWAIVPKEPTPEIEKAIGGVISENLSLLIADDSAWDILQDGWDTQAEIYRAMVEAGQVKP